MYFVYTGRCLNEEKGVVHTHTCWCALLLSYFLCSNVSLPVLRHEAEFFGIHPLGTGGVGSFIYYFYCESCTIFHTIRQITISFKSGFYVQLISNKIAFCFEFKFVRKKMLC